MKRKTTVSVGQNWVEMSNPVLSPNFSQNFEPCLLNGLPPLAKLLRVLIVVALVSGLDPDFGDPFWHTIRA